ncbi:hypothetical protein J4Q44_G00318300 [Coregonus suidteri]|uniref:Uncharacterized protein n=1 Tax=Coregonus suidteri TaxID=861788 RepID=A0AAN8QPS9_9TELE
MNVVEKVGSPTALLRRGPSSLDVWGMLTIKRPASFGKLEDILAKAGDFKFEMIPPRCGEGQPGLSGPPVHPRRGEGQPGPSRPPVPPRSGVVQPGPSGPPVPPRSGEGQPGPSGFLAVFCLI